MSARVVEGPPIRDAVTQWPNAGEVLQRYRVHAELQLLSFPGSSTTGCTVNIAAQDAADATGLPLTYEESFQRERTVKPGDSHLYADAPKGRTLRDVWEDLARTTSLRFQLNFPLGTDPEVARAAVQVIVATERVPIVMRVYEEIKVKDAQHHAPILGSRPGSRK